MSCNLLRPGLNRAVDGSPIGSSEMKFLSKKQVRDRIGLSLAHIDRMETETEYAHLGFPKRVRVGFRVFWLDEEIESFMQARIAERDRATGS
jgi:predicted DNA-binding transcriptional regulator AlpA